MIVSRWTLLFVGLARIRNFGNARGADLDLMADASEIYVIDVEVGVQDDCNHRIIEKLKVNLGIAPTLLDQLRPANLGFVKVLLVGVIVQHGACFRERGIGYEDYSYPVMDMAVRNANRVIIFPGMQFVNIYLAVSKLIVSLLTACIRQTIDSKELVPVYVVVQSSFDSANVPLERRRRLLLQLCSARRRTRHQYEHAEHH